MKRRFIQKREAHAHRILPAALVIHRVIAMTRSKWDNNWRFVNVFHAYATNEMNVTGAAYLFRMACWAVDTALSALKWTAGRAAALG